METSPKHAKHEAHEAYIWLYRGVTEFDIDSRKNLSHQYDAKNAKLWSQCSIFCLCPLPTASVIKWISASLPSSLGNLKPYIVLDVVVEVVRLWCFFIQYLVLWDQSNCSNYISAGASSGTCGALSFMVPLSPLFPLSSSALQSTKA